MKFLNNRKYESYRKKEPYTISEALMYSMDDAGYGHGIEDQISTVESNLRNTSTLVADLIQTLFEAGIIPEEVVLKMVAYHFEKMEEDV